MGDCSALADSKVATRPLLYLPADFPKPAPLDGIATRCHVDVKSLPQVIHRLGELQPTKLPRQGLLYLPNPYVVPGGFFNEMYGWDSYFIVLGLIADQRESLARSMVDNALFEVAHYGAVLNANRSYYLTRSQPPFPYSMIRAVLDDPASFPDGRRYRLAAPRLSAGGPRPFDLDTPRASRWRHRPCALLRLWWSQPGAGDTRR